MKSLFEDTVFYQSLNEHTDQAREYMFSDTQCLNTVRPDPSLLEPRQHEIDPPYHAVVAMCVNHPEFMVWVERELYMLGLDEIQIAEFNGLADAALRCIPTAKLLKEMDMHSDHNEDTEFDLMIQQRNEKQKKTPTEVWLENMESVYGPEFIEVLYKGDDNDN